MPDMKTGSSKESSHRSLSKRSFVRVLVRFDMVLFLDVVLADGISEEVGEASSGHFGFIG